MSHPAMISGSPTAQPGQHFVVREKGGKINVSCVQDNLSSVDISVANHPIYRHMKEFTLEKNHSAAPDVTTCAKDLKI